MPVIGTDSATQTSIPQQVPEFRNPSSPDTHKTAQTAKSNKVDEKPVQPLRNSDAEMLEKIPDSVDVQLTTEPWAHVFLHNQQLGTTPLSAALRLPTGVQTLTLRNPAFPAIELPVTLIRKMSLSVRLSDYVSTVRAQVEPWGELYVDGEHVGTTPLAETAYTSHRGEHELRITHPNLASVQRTVNTVAGQALDLEVNLNKGTFDIALDTEGIRETVARAWVHGVHGVQWNGTDDAESVAGD